jgi:glucokinase
MIYQALAGDIGGTNARLAIVTVCGLARSGAAAVAARTLVDK